MMNLIDSYLPPKGRLGLSLGSRHVGAPYGSKIRKVAEQVFREQVAKDYERHSLCLIMTAPMTIRASLLGRPWALERPW